MKLRCLLGHDWGAWFAHTDGPCVFQSSIHIFRRCLRCSKNEHLFAEINNGPDFRPDGKPDLIGRLREDREGDKRV